MQSLSESAELEKEYQKNARFNELLDDESDVYTLDLNLEDNSLYRVSRISKALFYADNTKYDELLKAFNEKRRAEVLSCDEFDFLAERQIKRFRSLSRVLANHKSVLFLGAGVPASLGLPTWERYIRSLATERQIEPETINNWISESDLAVASGKVIEACGVNHFVSSFSEDFDEDPSGSDLYNNIMNLPRIMVMTTNYDKTIETFENINSRPFDDIKNGNGTFDSLFQLLGKGNNILLKMHGTISDASSRILVPDDYTNYYGDPLDLEKPLPQITQRLFAHYPFLFIGCSLTQDRILECFKSACQTYELSKLPSHFAILEEPEDEASITDRDKLLLDEYGIQAIWYPNGEHQKLLEVIELLLEEI